MTLTNGKTQNLRGFTAQVRGKDCETILGTAFAIDREHGILITCKHVVLKVDQNALAKASPIWVYFPQITSKSNRLQRAFVHQYFSDYEDDIVTLKLESSPLYEEVETAILGSAFDSVGNESIHDFRSFGYRRLQKYQGLPSDGQIIDFSDKPFDSVLFSNPLMLKSQNVDSGMSGSAVLDLQRNLVVGMIAETWDSGREFADRDTAFAVDMTVLRVVPFSIELYDGFQYPLQPFLQPSEYAQRSVAEHRKKIFPLPYNFFDAPNVLPEWVGREVLLSRLSNDFNSSHTHIVGLVGFGGEGKTSLARQWISELTSKKIEPDGVFWWNLYSNQNAEALIEEAIVYLAGQEVANRFQNPTVRVELIGAMLKEHSILLVLDGLEVMQAASDDERGLIQNSFMRQLLEYFAASNHRSFCLITTRIPLTDLVTFTTYQEYRVERLALAEGHALFVKQGIRGDEDHINRLVEKWEGHALTLSIMSGYITSQHNGDLSKAFDLPDPLKQTESPNFIAQMLAWYDQKLNTKDRISLMLLSACRTPVTRKALLKIKNITDDDVDSIVNKLQSMKLIVARDDRSQNKHITLTTTLGTISKIEQEIPIDHHAQNGFLIAVHPLIARYYYSRLAEEQLSNTVHLFAAEYYIDLLRENITRFQELHQKLNAYLRFVTGRPSYNDLAPVGEIIYHLCHVGLYDVGFSIYENGVKGLDFRPSDCLIRQMQAYDTCINILSLLFPDNDIDQPPLTTEELNTAALLNDLGVALFYRGDLAHAATLFKRRLSYSTEDSPANYARTYVNLVNALVLLGDLDQAIASANNAVDWAEKESQENIRAKLVAFTSLAWAQHCLGKTDASTLSFSEATKAEQLLNSSHKYLTSARGIKFARHLLQTGNLTLAREVTEINFQMCQSEHWRDELCQCQTILGELCYIEGEYGKAQIHYNNALTIARELNLTISIIESLKGRGDLFFSLEQLNETRRDFTEALEVARKYDYKLHQISILVSLANVSIRHSDLEQAERYLKEASVLSETTKYAWGMGDTLQAQGRLYSAIGNIAIARQHYFEAITLRRRIKDRNLAESEASEKLLEVTGEDLLLKFIEDENPAVRIEAIRKLSQDASKQVVDRLISTLGDNNFYVRIEARNALIKLNNLAAAFLREALTNQNPQIRQMSAEALGAIGDSEAITELILALQDKEAVVRNSVVKTLKALKNDSTILYLCEMFSDPDENVQQSTIDALVVFGLKTVYAVSKYLSSDNKNTRLNIVKVLKKINIPEAYPLLVASLSDEEQDIRNAAASHLVENRNTEIIQILTEKLKSDNSLLRAASADVLGYIGDVQPIPALIPLLADPDKVTRSAAARALAKIGERAISQLVDALQHENSLIRGGAVTALGEIGSPSVVDPLISALTDHEGDVRFVAADFLGKIGDARAVFPLIQALADSYWKTRANAAAAFAKLKDRRAVAPLIVALNDENPAVRLNATAALAELNDDRAVIPLIGLLHDPDQRIRSNVIRILRSFKDERATEPLLSILNDENPETRKEVIVTLGELKDVRAVKPLIDALSNDLEEIRNIAREVLVGFGQNAYTQILDIVHSENAGVRASAIQMLGKIAYLQKQSDNTQTISILINALKDEDADVRTWAAAFIFDLVKPEDVYVVEYLIEALKDIEEVVRRNAAGTLGRFKDSRAVNPLIEALKDEKSTVRINAAESLGEIGDPRAIEPLVACLQDPSKEMQHWVQWSLKQLGYELES